MDDRRDELDLPTRMPLRPTAVGRGLPVPPLIPLIAVVCLLVGLAAGYRIAPDHGSTVVSATPSPTPSAPEITAPPPGPYVIWPGDGWMTFPPTMPTASPPALGLSMKEALSALESLGLGSPPGLVVSSAVDRYGNVGWDQSHDQDEWVWIFRIRGDPNGSIMVCTQPLDESTADPSASPSDLAWPIDGHGSPACHPSQTSVTVIIDYLTGELVETQETSY